MNADTCSDIQPEAEAAASEPASGAAPGACRSFLKEYWLWIVIPFVLVLGLLTLAYFMMADDGATPFVYNIY